MKRGRRAKLLLTLCTASMLATSAVMICGCECDHAFNKTTVPPTCSTEGYELRTCTKCGIEEKDVIPATNEHVKDEGRVTKKPTCKEGGESYYFCKDCGKQLEKKEDIKPTGDHDWDEGTVIEQSTCTKEGTTKYRCRVCGEEDEKNDLPLKDHTYTLSDTYWEQEGYQAPTETHCAMIPLTCSECKQSFPKEYDSTTFSFAENKIRFEDKYNTSTPILFDKDNQYLILNLSGSDLTKVLESLSSEKIYDAENKILTIPSVYKSTTLKQVKVRGFKSPNSSFAMTTEVCDSINLILENISYTAPEGKVGLDLANTNKATVEIVGLVAITGGNNGMNGITAKELEISGKGSLTVTGGNGVAGVKSSGSGTNGGIGLKASVLSFSLDGTVDVVGGNGGAAYNRPSGDNDGEGSNGRDGFTGGNGGVGVFADSFTVTKGQYTITGGNGARGGDGSECNRSEWINTGSRDVFGGKGGDGGNGATALETATLNILGGTLSLTGGNGGDSGKRGGCHDDDHEGNIGVPSMGMGYKTTATDGSAGAAGKGGKGLSETCTTEGVEDLFTAQNGQDGNATNELNQS